MSNILLISIFTFLSLIFLRLYIFIWNIYFKDKIPTGAGIILLFIYSYSLIYNFNLFEQISLYYYIFFVLSCVYFLDDIYSLDYKIRIFLILLISVLLLLLLSSINSNVEFNLLNLVIVILIFFLAVNYLNFQDGADLNLLVISFSIVLIFIFFNYPFYSNNSIFFNLLIGFFISFSFFNYKPKNLYLGDTGALLLATLLCLYISYSILENQKENLLFLSPLLFIFIDCSYVLMVRIYKKENLLSRNFLHLYQKYEIKFKNKFYLIPYFINYIFIVFITQLFFVDIITIYQALVIIISITLISYFTFSFYLIKKNEL